jgi:hypothetical protein
VPVFADQPFWAQRVFQLGAGPPPIPPKRLTEDVLTDAIRATASKEMRRRAPLLARRSAKKTGWVVRWRPFINMSEWRIDRSNGAKLTMMDPSPIKVSAAMQFGLRRVSTLKFLASLPAEEMRGRAAESGEGGDMRTVAAFERRVARQNRAITRSLPRHSLRPSRGLALPGGGSSQSSYSSSLADGPSRSPRLRRTLGWRSCIWDLLKKCLTRTWAAAGARGALA